MNVKKLIKGIASVGAGVSVIDALVNNGKKLLDKNCEKIIISWNTPVVPIFLNGVIPIMEYLYKYDKNIYKNFNRYSMDLESLRFGKKDKIRNETFSNIMYGPSDGIRLIRITKKDIIILTFTNYENEVDSCLVSSGSMTIQIIGPNKKKIKRKLEHIGLHNGLLDTYSKTNDGRWISLDRNMNRTMDTIYSHQKSDILSAIENHEKRAKLYKKFGKKNKFTMLLYGEPGTGKSSMIEALANLYNRNLRIFGPGISEKTLIEAVTNGEFAIYVLEEVDLFFEAAIDTDSDNKSDSNDREGKLSILLQILDGLYTRENMFFIMTTNHVEKLDSRLTRTGRIDLMIELTGLDRHYAIKYCLDMGLNKAQIAKVINSFDIKATDKNPLYNQADLEKATLSYIK